MSKKGLAAATFEESGEARRLDDLEARMSDLGKPYRPEDFDGIRILSGKELCKVWDRSGRCQDVLGSTLSPSLGPAYGVHRDGDLSW